MKKQKRTETNDAGLLSQRQVMDRYGISAMCLFRWKNNPEMNFPKPIKINERLFYYYEQEIIAWERKRVKGRAA